MTREQELILLSDRIKKMIIDKQFNNQTFVHTVETLLTILQEHLEE